MATDNPKPSNEQKDIWSATTYSQKVAPFVAKLTTKIVSWLDPQPTGKNSSFSLFSSRI